MRRRFARNPTRRAGKKRRDSDGDRESGERDAHLLPVSPRKADSGLRARHTRQGFGAVPPRAAAVSSAAWARSSAAFFCTGSRKSFAARR
jgi:hypothetical protein